MSARIKRQNVATMKMPDSLEQDELSDFIRYQDEVLERNAQELRGVIEEQERQLEKYMREEEIKTESLYLKQDLMEALDEKLQESIRGIDTNIGNKMEEMDQKTDQYMVDLARRNAHWKDRLQEVGANITHHARSTGGDHWEERSVQKGINENYKSTYTSDKEEIWDDEEAIVVEGTPAADQDEIIEIVEEKVRSKPQRKSSTRKQVRKEETQERTPGRTQQQVKKPQYKRQQYTKHTTQTRQATSQRAQSTTSRGGTLESYPCPSCQKPLVYYDKYQRWWCRSCKKWR